MLNIIYIYKILHVHNFSWHQTIVRLEKFGYQTDLVIT